MKLNNILSVIAASLVIAGAAPALAADGGFSLDVGGKLATNTANQGMGWGGALDYRFADSPVSIGIGVRYAGLTNGANGSLIDMPLQLGYHMNSAADGKFDPYAYVGDDIQFVSQTVGPTSTSTTLALNPTFGLGARYYLTQRFGLQASVGGRIALDNGTTPQFVTTVGTAFRF